MPISTFLYIGTWSLLENQEVSTVKSEEGRLRLNIFFINNQGIAPLGNVRKMLKIQKLGRTMSCFLGNKRMQTVLFASLYVMVVYGQADTQDGSVAENLNKGFEQVSNTFVDIFDYLTYACWTAAAGVAVVGGFSVFSKFSNGEQDAKKSLIGLIFGIILLAVTPVVVKAVFFK